MLLGGPIYFLGPRDARNGQNSEAHEKQAGNP